MQDLIKKKEWERKQTIKKQAETRLVKVPDFINEVWADVNGFEGIYSVSNFGRIKSLCRVTIYGRHGGDKIIGEKIISPSCNKKGYYHTTLFRNSKRKYCLVHRIVANAFLRNPENKPEVNHIDGNPSNCHLSNLEWATKSENQIHSFRVLGNKGAGKGEEHKSCKLTYRQVREIRNKYIPRVYSTRKLAKEYNVSSSRIVNIINNKAKVYA